MLSTEERLAQLEKKVESLEAEIKSLKNIKTIASPPLLEPDIQPVVRTQVPSEKPTTSLSERVNTASPVRKNKTQEAFLGKYIVGGLAALLIFVGTASFIGLIWHLLSSEFKIGLMSTAGIVITGIGFWMMDEREKPIASVTLGIGAGLIFITILSANIAFHMIGNGMTLIISGLWASFFIFSSRYTNQFFTIVISNIGSLVTLILGLSYLKAESDYIALVLFVIAVSGVMYWTGREKGTRERNTIFTFMLLNLTLTLVGWFISSIASPHILSSPLMPILINVGMIILLNGIFKVTGDHKSGILVIFPGLLVTGMTAINWMIINGIFLKWSGAICAGIFFMILWIQLIFSHWKHKGLLLYLVPFYTVLLMMSGFVLAYEWYDAPVGVAVVGILLMALAHVFKTKLQSNLVAGILLLDSLLMWGAGAPKSLFLVIIVLQIVSTLYLLAINEQFSRGKTNLFLKVTGVLVMVVVSVSLSKTVLFLINPSVTWRTYLNVAYLLMLLMTAGLWRYQLFVEAFGEESTQTLHGKQMKTLLHTLLTGQYLCGIMLLNTSSHLGFKLVLTLAVTAVAMVQSALFIQSKKEANGAIGIWLVLKYLVLIWAVIRSFGQLEVTSVIYSVAGLIVAISSIVAGFKLSIKNIRLYGLILTIMMVAKFILVDLSQENSIVRVLALVFGGALCFLISYIYNRFNTEESSL